MKKIKVTTRSLKYTEKIEGLETTGADLDF